MINLVTSAILSFFNFISESILSLLSLPVVGNLAIPDDTFEALKKILSNIAYIVPINHFMIMLGFSFVLANFKTIWALILRIKSFIPSMGR